MTAAFTTDELICVCISRQVVNGEVLAQGLATPLVAAGYLLAWHTHAPDVYFASAIGQTICRQGAPLGLSTVEALWLDRAMNSFGFVRAAADLLPAVKPKEFFRPGQVDPLGNFNNIAFGDSYSSPRLRLPGTGGIPDVTTYFDKVYLYVPRHSKVTFVKELDFRSGLGHARERKHGSGPAYLVSDLGQFDFKDGKMRITHLHPGVDIRRVRAKTGFKLALAEDLKVTEKPTQEELHLLRDVIDPMRIRELELLGGKARKEALGRIVLAESGNQQG